MPYSYLLIRLINLNNVNTNEIISNPFIQFVSQLIQSYVYYYFFLSIYGVFLIWQLLVFNHLPIYSLIHSSLLVCLSISWSCVYNRLVFTHLFSTISFFYVKIYQIIIIEIIGIWNRMQLIFGFWGQVKMVSSKRQP